MRQVVKRKRLLHNPFLLFFPFLLFYSVFILLKSKNTLLGDEIRYVFFAQNLTHGHYLSPDSSIGLANGPGYPILLAPFAALNSPVIYMRLLNAILQYLSVVFLFKALREKMSFKAAFMVSLFWACYYNFLQYMALMYTEIISIFLVSILIFFLIKAFDGDDVKKARRYIYLSGITIGYLALTKVIFGYVILFMLATSLLLWLMKRQSENYRKGLIILSIAFATTLPYLIYTYNLTGKMFYWSSTGGDNLYWMSTPYDGEYGSWFWFSDVNSKSASANVENMSAAGVDSVRLHHQKIYEEIKKYDEITQDELLRKAAINNIKSHPAKFLQNCVSNIGRILFNYPYTYTPQRPSNLLRIPLNGIIVVFLLFCIVPTIMNWREIIYPLRFMVIFVLLYLGGSVLGSAETRMFTVAVPILLFWIAFIVQKTMKVKLKFG